MRRWKASKREVEKAEDFIGGVRRLLVYDIVEHSHGDVTHRHAWGSAPHNHAMRAVCNRDECEGYPTHNIHPMRSD